jgi:hypothetical protein
MKNPCGVKTKSELSRQLGEPPKSLMTTAGRTERVSYPPGRTRLQNPSAWRSSPPRTLPPKAGPAPGGWAPGSTAPKPLSVGPGLRRAEPREPRAGEPPANGRILARRNAAGGEGIVAAPLGLGPESLELRGRERLTHPKPTRVGAKPHNHAPDPIPGAHRFTMAQPFINPKAGSAMALVGRYFVRAHTVHLRRFGGCPEEPNLSRESHGVAACARIASCRAPPWAVQRERIPPVDYRFRSTCSSPASLPLPPYTACPGLTWALASGPFPLWQRALHAADRACARGAVAMESSAA